MNYSHTTFTVNLKADWSISLDGQFLSIESSTGFAYVHRDEIVSFCIDERDAACISTRHALFRLILHGGETDAASSRGVRDLLKLVHIKLIAAEKLADALNADAL